MRVEPHGVKVRRIDDFILIYLDFPEIVGTWIESYYDIQIVLLFYELYIIAV